MALENGVYRVCAVRKNDAALSKQTVRNKERRLESLPEVDQERCFLGHVKDGRIYFT
jgi:hypothetical protein